MARGTILLIGANPELCPYPVYPLSLPRLAGALISKGYAVHQHDVLVDPPDELDRTLRESRPFLVGMSLRNIDNTDSVSQRSYIEDYASLAARVRSACEAPLVLGGSGFSLFPERLIRRLGADFGIAGRGEEALCSLAERLAEGAPATGIPGLFIKGEARANHLACPPSNGTLGSAVVPHEPRLLKHYWRSAGMIGIQSKVGCAQRCVYCTYPLIDGRKFRHFEAESIVDEMRRLKMDFGIEYVFFVDSIFNADRAREMDLAELLIRRQIDMRWGGFFSPRGVDEEYLTTLKRSGLVHLELGSDSFSDTVLDAYKKGFQYPDVLHASQAAQAAGVHVAHYLILGGPGETKETLAETLGRSKALGRAVFFPGLGVRVYPQTPMADLARAEGFSFGEDGGLSPRFFFAPGLDAASIEKQVRKATGKAANWVLPQDYAKCQAGMRQLRALGKTGPLWEFLCR